MKKITLTLVLAIYGLFSPKLYAQLDSTLVASLVTTELTRIQYVFEGIVVDVDMYAGDDQGNRYTSDDVIWNDRTGGYTYKRGRCWSIATVVVCQKYKDDGSIGDTIRILTESNGGVQFDITYDSIGNVIEDVSYFDGPYDAIQHEFFRRGQVGSKQIFFAFDHTYSGVLPQIKILSIIGGIDLHIWGDPYSSLDYDTIFAKSLGVFAFSKRLFASREEMYEFLEEIPILNLDAGEENICLPPSMKGKDEKKNVGSEENPLDKPKYDYQQNLKNYNDFINKRLQIIDENKNRNRDKSKKVGETLILEMANPRVTGSDNAPWLEFDIMVSANVSTYFDGCLMHLSFDNTPSNYAFGSWLYSNSNIQITRATAFNNSTYLNPHTYSVDVSAYVLTVLFVVDDLAGSWNRTLVTTTPQKMLQVRMKIQNKDKSAGIQFTNQTTTATWSSFTVNSTDSPTSIISYDFTNYNGSNNDKTCIPIITNFNDNVPAGVGQILTIEGRYFGDSISKNGTVIFKNANRGNVYPSGNTRNGIDKYDVVSWGHNLIEIRLPSMIDSITARSSDDDYHSTPGSGKFIVHNRYGSSGETASVLKIPYAVSQKALIKGGTYAKRDVKLSGVNNNGYTIYLNHNVTAAYPSARAVISKAMREWTCVTGVKWELGKDTSLGAVFQDEICVITLGSTDSALQRTENEWYNCSASPYQVYQHAFDIIISSLVTWDMDTSGNVASGKYDFFHAISHELGHGHLIKHVNEPNVDLMYYGTKIGPTNAAQRKTVKKSPDAQDGGVYVATYRTGTIACASQHVISVPQNCTPVGIDEIENKSGIKAYPNPISSGYLNIEIEQINWSNTEIVIYDNLGRLVDQIEPNIITRDGCEIPIGYLSRGMYIVQIISEGQRQSVKFIKY
jgi:hypothetical protein